MKQIGVVQFFAVLALPTTASGHHSMAEYGGQEIRELTGEVAAVRWANPHITLELAVPDGSDNAIWTMEALPRSQLDREGVPHDAVQVGDVVTVAGTESSTRPQQMLLKNILLVDGTELLVHPASESRWDAVTVGGEEQPHEASTIRDSETSAAGIFRVWRQASRIVWPDELPLTDSAEAAFAAFDPVADDPYANCTAPGMIRAMTGAWPIEFSEDGGNIILRIEEYDLVRTIHLAPAPTAATGPRTPLGFSVGMWDEVTLTVGTTRINWPYFSNVAIPQSSEIAVIEQFRLSDDDTRLEYEITVTDPQTFLSPVTGRAAWLWEPGLERNPHECILGG